MMKLFFTPALIVSALSITQPAQARDWGQVSGWYISSAPESCGMFAPANAKGASDTVILKRIDGALFIHITNPAWALKKLPGSDMRFLIDGKAYDGPATVAAVSGGYIAGFGESFENELRAGTILRVQQGGSGVDEITLSGTTAAFDRIQSCLAELQTRSANLAAEPGGKPPQPIAAGQWISALDYPAAALRDRREGIVTLRTTVTADGKAKDCEVTRSSGHSDLDQATCSAILKKARFKPAEDAAGRKVEAIFSTRITWAIP